MLFDGNNLILFLLARTTTTSPTMTSIKNAPGKSIFDLSESDSEELPDLETRGPNTADEFIDENSPLHNAAARGHTQYLETLLNNGASVNSKNQYGSTLLHLASTHGHIKSMNLLLSRGANVQARNRYGNTALHMAALNGQVEAVKLLVEKGIDINVTNNSGSTPLHYSGQFEI